MVDDDGRDSGRHGSDAVWREAERLAGTVLSMASAAARGLGGTEPAGTSHAKGFATGGAACCVCPVCRLITAVGEPGPEAMDRLARRAGDLAVSMTGMLRTLSSHRRGDERPSTQRRDTETTPTTEHVDGTDPWRAATTGPPPPDGTVG